MPADGTHAGAANIVNLNLEPFELLEDADVCEA
jgi:hypothetical protein